MVELQEYIEDLQLCLTEFGKDMEACYNSGSLEDAKYYPICSSTATILNKLCELQATGVEEHGQAYYLEGLPLLFVPGAGLYFEYGQETKPIRYTVIEEFVGKQKARVAMLPTDLDKANED